MSVRKYIVYLYGLLFSYCIIHIRVNYKMPTKRTIVFDVCGTLYNMNTTFSFIDFLADQGVISYFYVRMLRSLKVPLVLLGRLFRYDIYRYLYIYSLKGVQHQVLLDFSDGFYLQVLSKHEISGVMELFRTYTKSSIDTDVVLSSASLDCIVQVIAKHLGVGHYLSSELDYVDGACRGQLRVDFLGKKHEYQYENLQCVVTDNKSDIQLLMLANEKVVVSKVKDIPFWRSVGIPVSFVVDN